MSTLQELLTRALRQSIGAEDCDLLASRIDAAVNESAGRLPLAYTRTSRLSAGPLRVDGLAADLSAAAPGVDFDRWTTVDAGRALLLLTVIAATGPDAGAVGARACYDAADASEQQSWLRGVSLLPDAGQYLPLVIDACRTNVVPVFAAVANGNPYPADHFPDRNFNQLVLKALFNGVPLAAIVGLARRKNADLARMAADYAAERRAAGRTVPDDIGLAL